MLENLRQAVAEAEADNSDFQYGVAKFRDLYHLSISPAVSEVDVRKMLLQHILTQDILLRVLGQVQFRNENNVAGQLSALEKTFFTGDVRRQAIDRLRSDYRAIGRAADEVADYPQEAEVPAGDLRGLLQGLQPRRCRLPAAWAWHYNIAAASGNGLQLILSHQHRLSVLMRPFGPGSGGD